MMHVLNLSFIVHLIMQFYPIGVLGYYDVHSEFVHV